jgi:hypothetical protein
VKPADEVVHRLGFRDDVARLRVAERARVGERGQRLPVLFEVLNRVLGRDDHDHRFAAFIGLADRGDCDAR